MYENQNRKSFVFYTFFHSGVNQLLCGDELSEGRCAQQLRSSELTQLVLDG